MAVERVLAIDVGNTNTSLGLFVGKRLSGTWEISTDSLRRPIRRTQAVFREVRSKVPDTVIAVSVVPGAVSSLRALCRNCLGRRVLLLGRQVPFPLKNMYLDPSQVGQDRLANAVGALAKYGTACVIVDCGTATTIDVVDARRRYLGGLIFPGIGLSLWALSQGTALLPLCRPSRRSKVLIGRETTESMLIGTVHSIAEACNGLVPRLSKAVKVPVTAVLTGGGAQFLREHLTFRHRYDRNICLRGIIESFEISRKSLKD